MRKVKYAGVAQLVEQRIRNAQVVGSSPTTSLKSPSQKDGLSVCSWQRYGSGTAGGGSGSATGLPVLKKAGFIF